MRMRTHAVFAAVVAVLVAAPGRIASPPRRARPAGTRSTGSSAGRERMRPAACAATVFRARTCTFASGTSRSSRLSRSGAGPPSVLGCEGEGDGATLLMGDLALLGSEVNPVARELEARGLEVLAIHNHLLEESPRVVYVHFHGHAGAAGARGRARRRAAKDGDAAHAAGGIPLRADARRGEAPAPIRGRARPQGHDGRTGAAVRSPPRRGDPRGRRRDSAGHGNGERHQRPGGGGARRDDRRLRARRRRGQPRHPGDCTRTAST